MSTRTLHLLPATRIKFLYSGQAILSLVGITRKNRGLGLMDTPQCKTGDPIMILAAVIHVHEATVSLVSFSLTKAAECNGPGLWTMYFTSATVQDLQMPFQRSMSKRDGMRINGIGSVCGLIRIMGIALLFQVH